MRDIAWDFAQAELPAAVMGNLVQLSSGCMIAHHALVFISRIFPAILIAGPIVVTSCTTEPGGAGPDGVSCANAVKDDGETDVDCGGVCAEKCAALKGCAVDPDCGGGLVCVKKVCAAVTSTDGVKSGSETDVDCGGLLAPPCEVGAACLSLLDCVEKVCEGGKCAPPGPNDGVKNGDETDVDCGGAKAPPCANTKACSKPSDCASSACTANVCTGASSSDGLQNGAETDVDCGGGPPTQPCPAGKKCTDGARDCASKVCTGDVCQAPNGNDGVQNGDETGLDCGGTTAATPRCGTGVACLVHEDCASKGCGFDQKCAPGRSCTRQLGGVTCGAGEVGDPAAVHESCCARATLDLTNVKMDKYHVTAGRMRAFIERENGDVRKFAKTTPGWNAAWDALVPSTVAEANTMLGSYWNGAPNDSNGANSKRSCAPGGFGGHTYWTAPDGEDYSDFTQNELDVKALNCVDWHLARAFCSWDGGRLPTSVEISDAWKNGKATTYPWGNASYNAGQADERLNHQFNYGYPNPAGRRLLGPDGDAADISWHVSPPGRFPLGRNTKGVDIAGNLLQWVGDGEYLFNYTLSWERHPGSLANGNWKTNWPGEPNGYYAVGFRCVYD